MKKVDIFTDGACSGNPGPGGWGTILRYNGHEKELSGGARDTTNNRMEMTAVIEGLKALTAPCDVTIHSDSRYVIDGATQWLAGWKKRDWKAAGRKPLKNSGLWKSMDQEIARHHSVNWVWVKGHSGHPENERADQLARDAVPHPFPGEEE